MVKSNVSHFFEIHKTKIKLSIIFVSKEVCFILKQKNLVAIQTIDEISFKF